MIVELINTGSELMLGRVLNTHQQWLCRELTNAGYLVSRQVAVPDTAVDIQLAVKEALGRADLIITTGGLGPTSDDITRDLIAQLLGKRLHQDPAILERIEGYFTSRKRPMPESTRVQALVPEGAIVLPNPNGTAPGLAMEVAPNRFRAAGGPSWIIMLPGPPRELRPMFTDTVLPLLKKSLPPPLPYFCRNLRTSGIGESMVEERIKGALVPLVERGLEIGYCARIGQVDVRLSATGNEASLVVNDAAGIVAGLLGAFVCGEGDDEIEAGVVRLLTERHQTVAIAESCTGGLIANRITNVPGASAVFLAGFVTYSNQAKQDLLGVRAATLERVGAVSEEVVREMAEGALDRGKTDYAIAVTGIAGPAGGSPEKPVGTVYIGLAGGGPTLAVRHFNNFDRETFKYATSQQAMDLLRRRLCG